MSFDQENNYILMIISKIYVAMSRCAISGLLQMIYIYENELSILTTSRKRIDDEIIAGVGSSLVRIGIFEFDDNWFPFKSFSPPDYSDYSRSDEGEEEDDEEISDT